MTNDQYHDAIGQIAKASKTLIQALGADREPETFLDTEHKSCIKATKVNCLHAAMTIWQQQFVQRQHEQHEPTAVIREIKLPPHVKRAVAALLCDRANEAAPDKPAEAVAQTSETASATDQPAPAAAP